MSKLPKYSAPPVGAAKITTTKTLPNGSQLLTFRDVTEQVTVDKVFVTRFKPKRDDYYVVTADGPVCVPGPHFEALFSVDSSKPEAAGLSL